MAFMLRSVLLAAVAPRLVRPLRPDGLGRLVLDRRLPTDQRDRFEYCPLCVQLIVVPYCIRVPLRGACVTVRESRRDLGYPCPAALALALETVPDSSRPRSPRTGWLSG
jgi:hypothetical protein